jgi:hypothetical protein
VARLSATLASRPTPVGADFEYYEIKIADAGSLSGTLKVVVEDPADPVIDSILALAQLSAGQR